MPDLQVGQDIALTLVTAERVSHKTKGLSIFLVRNGLEILAVEPSESTFAAIEKHKSDSNVYAVKVSRKVNTKPGTLQAFLRFKGNLVQSEIYNILSTPAEPLGVRIESLDANLLALCKSFGQLSEEVTSLKDIPHPKVESDGSVRLPAKALIAKLTELPPGAATIHDIEGYKQDVLGAFQALTRLLQSGSLPVDVKTVAGKPPVVFDPEKDAVAEVAEVAVVHELKGDVAQVGEVLKIKDKSGYTLAEKQVEAIWANLAAVVEKGLKVLENSLASKLSLIYKMMPPNVTSEIEVLKKAILALTDLIKQDLDIPDPKNVRAGLEYDRGRKTGTYVLPPKERVLEGVKVGDEMGTFRILHPHDVRFGIGYGNMGEEFKGQAPLNTPERFKSKKLDVGGV